MLAVEPLSHFTRGIASAQRQQLARRRIRRPADGARPLLRVNAHVSSATFAGSTPRSAATTTGENALADQLDGSFRLGMLNLAKRGFFSMGGFLRLSRTDADRAATAFSHACGWAIGAGLGAPLGDRR